MEQLNKFFKNLLEKVKDLAASIEESSFYERLLTKYDSMEPSQARRLGYLFFTLCFIGAVALYVYPLWNVVAAKTELSDYRRMLMDLEALNAKHKPQAKKTYTPPPGWQNLPSNTHDEFLTSVDQYLAQLGVVEALTKIQSENSETQIDFQEITIKQAVSFLFQLEGWYPGVKITRTQIKAHPESKELLQMLVAFRYDGSAAGTLSDGPASSFGGDDSFDDATMTENPPTTAQGVNPGGGAMPPGGMPRGGMPNSNESFNDGFNNGGDDFDIPPPPPPPPILDDFNQDMPPPLEEDL